MNKSDKLSQVRSQVGLATSRCGPSYLDTDTGVHNRTARRVDLPIQLRPTDSCGLRTPSVNGLGGGSMSTCGTIRIQPTARPPPPSGARGGLILIHACYRVSLVAFNSMWVHDGRHTRLNPLLPLNRIGGT